MRSDSFKMLIIGTLAVLLISYLLSIPVLYAVLLLVILLVAIPLGGRLFSGKRVARGPLRFLSGRSEFLCDDCRYNYGNACSRRDRPNATQCPDYRP
jgi:hypothetical protein